jgi:cytidylate kinase
VSPREARTYIERMDTQRDEFLKKYFHHDVTSPHVHDLVINTEQLGDESSLNLLLSAVQSWLKSRSSATPIAGGRQTAELPSLVTSM